MPYKTLIIGFGNTLRGDDAVGPYIARRLAALGFNAIEAHQLLPEHAEAVAAAREVVFLDASESIPPGAVRRREVEAGIVVSHEHRCTPQQLLAVARDVYHATPEALLIEIGAKQFDFGAMMSEPVQSAADRIVEMARATGVP